MKYAIGQTRRGKPIYIKSDVVIVEYLGARIDADGYAGERVRIRELSTGDEWETWLSRLDFGPAPAIDAHLDEALEVE